MFEFVKKVFFAGLTVLSLTVLSTLTSVNSLSCILMNNQKCEVRLQIVNVNSDEPVFFLLALKQVNTVVVVTILVLQMQKCVFLML